jgi:ubiquinone/menaquinone biosynthesis C-methylase UbiE
MNIDIKKLESELNKSLAAHEDRIGHNDRLFLQRIYGEGLLKYQDRLRAIGFSEYDHVLDAGCGYGQWSIALAEMNSQVSSCDISPLRIDFLRDMVKNLRLSNLNLTNSGIDLLPYADASFDAVFCYGVIFLTPWRQTLIELARVLKPGGTLYVNANGLGWYMFLWQEEHNKADDYDPKAVAARTLSDTIRYDRENYYESGMNLVIEPRSIELELRRMGFENIQTAPEGNLHLNKSYAAPKNFFKGEYSGQIGVYEMTAKKICIPTK